MSTSYEKQNFQPGDILCAHHLNKMDQQIAKNTEDLKNVSSYRGMKYLSGAPNEHTSGFEGQFAFDTSHWRLYVCIAGESVYPDQPSTYPYVWRPCREFRYESGAPDIETYGTSGEMWFDVEGPAIYTCRGGGVTNMGPMYDWVKLFGDDVASEAELYAAAAAGGVINLAPDADITVSQTLDLPEGTIILGNGAVIRRAAGFEKGLFNLSSGCHLENFTIDGNRLAMINPTWNKTYEVNMKTDAHGCVIENITINNGNEGIIVSGYDNIVRGCKLYNLGGNGIHFGSAYRCIAEDCTIIGANKSASVMGNSRGCIYTCMYVEDVDIVNCYCEDGLAGVGGIDAPDNARIKVTGCTVKNCTQAVEGETGAGGGATELIFSENQFVDCGNFYISDTGHNYPPANKLVISGNIFKNTGIRLSGCRNTVISGNTIRGGFIRAEKCPYCLISDNIVDNPNENAMNIAFSPHISISGNSLRAPKRGVHAEDSEGILLFGNVFRQHPNSFGYDILKLLRCPESAVDNNKMYAYSGDGFSAGSNCRVMGNYIVVADSNMPAITVYGGNKNYIVAQNMSNGKFSIANGTDAVVQNNIPITSDAFKTVTFELTNITASGLAKCLTDDDYTCTLTAADGYTLPDTITVTMSGTALVSGKGYAYDKASGKVTVYRVSGAVEVTGGAV